MIKATFAFYFVNYILYITWSDWVPGGGGGVFSPFDGGGGGA